MKINYFETFTQTRSFDLEFDPQDYYEWLEGGPHTEESLIDYLVELMYDTDFDIIRYDYTQDKEAIEEANKVFENWLNHSN